MKNKSSTYLSTGWQVLTEVPGWTDAPVHARLGRALPVIFPIVAILVIASGYFGYYQPHSREVAERLRPLLALEKEIASLELTTSEGQRAELNDRITGASRLLVNGPKELPGLLQELKETMHGLGWEATFQTGETVEETSGAEPAQIAFLPVRAKLKAQASNQDRFTTFLAVLDRLSSAGKRIDLTRVAIRADETRWQAVEVNLRFVCPLLDAKTPQ